MSSTPGPVRSRGRDKHVIGMVMVPDALLLEVAIAQAVFGPTLGPMAEIMGVPTDSPYELVLVGEQRRQKLARGGDFGELAPLETLRQVDTVIVPGVAEHMAERSDALIDALCAASDAGARMVAFCSGAFILARTGILDGRPATTHWMLAPDFRASFPRVRLDVDQLYIDDPPVHTSGGLFAASDLSLHLMSLDNGQAVANDRSRLLVSAPQRTGGQAQFIKDSLRQHASTPLDGLLDWIRDNLHENLTLATLARHAHISERSLVRRFRETTGLSAGEWIARERVNRAKVLLETTDFPVGEIAAMVGFGTRESFRRNFERVTGSGAVSYRRTFRAQR